MRAIAGWVSPEMMRTLGWTLLHFLWQGAAVAAFLAAILAFVRRADQRYALSVAALALMIGAPAATFTFLWNSAPDASSAALHTQAAPEVAVSASHRMASGFHSLAAVQTPTAPPDVLFWFVQVWFAGVLLLSLRTAGGFILVEHLRRREVKDVTEELRERCLALQRRLGIERAIRYCECLRLDAPAVIGWFRPVVLLPVMALTGLSEGQLEIVIAHELAHIRRFDSFVNLFQITAETLLFYHPAIWWVNRNIRFERESCCDDLAVTTCGNAVEYARALATMEEWRATPMLAMGANRGSLTARVGRLLGVGTLGSRVRSSGFAAGLLCMVGALAAGNALLGYERIALAPNVSATRSIAAADPVVVEVHRLVAAEVQAIVKAVATSVTRELIGAPKPGPKEQQSAAPSTKSEETGTKQSYIDQMEAAGFKNLSADDLISLKVQGVTPEYIRAMRDLGFKVDADEIVGMKVQGVTPEYVHAMRELGFKVGADDVIGMKAMGVTEEYVRTMRAAGLNADADQIVGMKSQGITPEYMRAMQALGIKADADELIGLKAQGVSPEYIHEMSALGLATKADDLIGMKAQGISPEYVREMQALSLKPTTDDLIGMKAQGVTPEYIREMRALGLEVSSDDVVGLKAQGVTPDYVKMLQSAGLGKVTADDCAGAKAQGITPEFIEKVRKHGFKDLDLDKLIALRNAGVFSE
jgi:beta-lactamase regulating signal transducer with metallopeptidase domain